MGVTVLIGAAAVLAAGCGGDDGGTEAPLPPTTTTPQQPAKVPQGWTRRVDTTIGYTVAIPPGWKATERAAATLVRSPDHLVAVSISADRTAEGLGLPAEDFATQALAALAGYNPPLNPGPLHPFRGTPLSAVSATATGTLAASGVEQRVTLVVLRHDDYVNYTAVVASNRSRVPPFERDLGLQMVRTLRDYPIGAPVGPSSGV